jgi:hypothetical protein
MLPQTIEDLILYIYDPMNGFDRKGLPPRDRSILFSMASQLKKPLALTHRQAELSLKIITENKPLYERIETLDRLLEFPIYKYPFRVIDISRRIFLLNKETIAIKFPFDNSINKILDKIPGRKIYNINERCHTFKLNESNLSVIINSFKEHHFDIELKLLNWYNEIMDIRSHPENYIPSIDIINNDDIKLLNCNRNIEEYFLANKGNTLSENLFLSKTMGLHQVNSVHTIIDTLDISSLSKKILLTDKNKAVVSAYTVPDITEALTDLNAFPILIFVEDTDKLIDEFNHWISALNNNNIDNSNISVLFRSDKNVEFNQIIKNNKLNNHVDQDIKVVFVKHKIPKILYKINFVPKLIISSNIYYVHYSSQKLVDSHPIILYYTEQTNKSLDKKIAKL